MDIKEHAFGKEYQVEFVSEDGKKITTDSNLKYIGMTKEFIFLFNIKKGNMRVFEMKIAQHLLDLLKHHYNF